MNNTTETMTAEQIINQVSVLDIPEFRADLRKMTDQHFSIVPVSAIILNLITVRSWQLIHY